MNNFDAKALRCRLQTSIRVLKKHFVVHTLRAVKNLFFFTNVCYTLDVFFDSVDSSWSFKNQYESRKWSLKTTPFSQKHCQFWNFCAFSFVCTVSEKGLLFQSRIFFLNQVIPILSFSCILVEKEAYEGSIGKRKAAFMNFSVSIVVCMTSFGVRFLLGFGRSLHCTLDARSNFRGHGDVTPLPSFPLKYIRKSLIRFLLDSRITSLITSLPR